MASSAHCYCGFEDDDDNDFQDSGRAVHRRLALRSTNNSRPGRKKLKLSTTSTAAAGKENVVPQASSHPKLNRVPLDSISGDGGKTLGFLPSRVSNLVESASFNGSDSQNWQMREENGVGGGTVQITSSSIASDLCGCTNDDGRGLGFVDSLEKKNFRFSISNLVGNVNLDGADSQISKTGEENEVGEGRVESISSLIASDLCGCSIDGGKRLGLLDSVEKGKSTFSVPSLLDSVETPENVGTSSRIRNLLKSDYVDKGNSRIPVTNLLDSMETAANVRTSYWTCDSLRSDFPISNLLDSKEIGENEGTCSELKLVKEGNYYSKSIESRLLGSSIKNPAASEVQYFDEFEPGTLLEELMNVCSEKDLCLEPKQSVECPFCGKDISFLSNEMRNVHTNDCLASRKSEQTLGFAYGIREGTDELDANDAMQNRNGSVDCPFCGNDITRLSYELRQVHTNECLDKNGASERGSPSGEKLSESSGQVVDANRVSEWLRSLGLSKYEEAFIREEVDWETLQWLTEEDLVSIGVTTLGPRKKIVHALNGLRKRNNEEHIHVSTSANNDPKQVVQNKLITEYFQGYNARSGATGASRSIDDIEQRSKNSLNGNVKKRKSTSKAKPRDIPPWCSIPGTPFRVDAFRYLRGGCSHWFLTHFHLDHYQGLTRNFCHGKIYCSSVTASLVNTKIGVPWDKLYILPLNKKINIAGVNITCIDANHCPGSLIILFELPNGKAILHTGDFRYSEEMLKNPILRSCHINTLILDTTYCNPQYDFPKQEAVIQFVIEAIQAETFNPKTLFLIGSYNVGKEKLFLEVARMLKKKIYVGAAKFRLLSCLGFSESDMQWFTANEMESQIHVVPMWTLASFKRMKHLSNQYSGRFDLIVAFSPTGWTFQKGKKKTPQRRWQQGTIIRYEVPYSEHSSYTELKEFVRFISPDHIIPSVNNEGPECANAMISLLRSDS